LEGKIILKELFGYEKEAEQKREVGERWVDKDGKEWEQQKGFVSASNTNG